MLIATNVTTISMFYGTRDLKGVAPRYYSLTGCKLQPISRAFHSEKYEIAYFWCETDHMFFKTRFEQEILVVKYANSTIATL